MNTNADPQDQGYPDLGTDHWDPLWDVCSDLAELPVESRRKVLSENAAKLYNIPLG